MPLPQEEYSTSVNRPSRNVYLPLPLKTTKYQPINHPGQYIGLNVPTVAVEDHLC